MLNRIFGSFLIMAMFTGPALAEDWAGTPLPTTMPSGIPGAPPIEVSHSAFSVGAPTAITAIPPNTLMSIGGIGSIFPDASAPDGISEFSTAFLPLSDFAKSSSLEAVQKQMNALSAQTTDLKNSLLRQTYASQGIAEAIAMAGTGAIQANETFAVNANWGTFDGQNSLAAGVAYRIRDHISLNGGFAASTGGGPVSGRIGFHFGW